MSNPSIASIGLVSDTHYQERLFDVPAGLEELWADADLILHAGDVGDLAVLDLLGTFAPTIAVHGNDEPARTKEILPSQPKQYRAASEAIVDFFSRRQAGELDSRTSKATT